MFQRTNVFWSTGFNFDVKVWYADQFFHFSCHVSIFNQMQRNFGFAQDTKESNFEVL